jgi:hypothetical protein
VAPSPVDTGACSHSEADSGCRADTAANHSAEGFDSAAAVGSEVSEVPKMMSRAEARLTAGMAAGSVAEVLALAVAAVPAVAVQAVAVVEEAAVGAGSRRQGCSTPAPPFQLLSGRDVVARTLGKRI